MQKNRNFGVQQAVSPEAKEKQNMSSNDRNVKVSSWSSNKNVTMHRFLHLVFIPNGHFLCIKEKSNNNRRPGLMSLVLLHTGSEI